MALLDRAARRRGLIVLTDSDGAGFVIRNRIKGTIPARYLKHAYIPDVYGKERRKRRGGKEGKLGVEGMSPTVLLEALRRCGATFEDRPPPERREAVTKADLVALGLSGGEGSAEKRRLLLKRLDLPEHLTANGMLEALNLLFGREELEVVDSQHAPGDIFEFLYDVCGYLLNNDVYLQHGETIGSSAEEKLPITRSPGAALDGVTLKIGF